MSPMGWRRRITFVIRQRRVRAPGIMPAVRLWHSTDDEGRLGIERDGFLDRPGPPEGPVDPAERGVWFANVPEAARVRASRHGWWIWIDVPDDLPEHDLGPEVAGHGTYLIPADQANKFPRGSQPGTLS